MINYEIFNDFNTIAISLLSVLKWILTPLTHILPYICGNSRDIVYGVKAFDPVSVLCLAYFVAMRRQSEKAAADAVSMDSFVFTTKLKIQE